MLATDEAILTAVQEKIKALDFPSLSIDCVYRFPDDFCSLPSLATPFVIVGMMENEREYGDGTFGMHQAEYSVYIRFAFSAIETLPSTVAFANVLKKSREVASVLGFALLTDQDFFGTTARRDGDNGNIEISDVYVVIDTREFAGVQFDIPIIQEI